MDDLIGEQRSETGQQAKDGAGRTQYRDIDNARGGAQEIQFNKLDEQVKGHGPESGKQIEKQKPLGPQGRLQWWAEHEKPEHIEEQVGNVTMHEHVGDDLVRLKKWRGRVEQRQLYPAQLIICGGAHQQGAEVHQDIDDEQIFYDVCNPKHKGAAVNKL